MARGGAPQRRVTGAERSCCAWSGLETLRDSPSGRSTGPKRRTRSTGRPWRSSPRAADDARADRTLRAIVLTGAGGAFVSGGDLRELRDKNSVHDAERFADAGSGLCAALEALSGPGARGDPGPGVRRGAELALACDVRIGDPAARTLASSRCGWGSRPRGGPSDGWFRWSVARPRRGSCTPRRTSRRRRRSRWAPRRSQRRRGARSRWRWPGPRTSRSDRRTLSRR